MVVETFLGQFQLFQELNHKAHATLNFPTGRN